MTRIALVNEMGGGWGHLLTLRTIAEAFLQRRCTITLLCREAEKARGAFSGMNVAVEQSPLWPPRRSGFSLNFAQNLWRNGYWDDYAFDAHFAWWSGKFRALKPAFVLTDFAPTALLSAMALGLPRGAVGTGFTLPPSTTPTPFLHPWLEAPDRALQESDDRVLAAIRRHVPAVRSVAGIFDGAARFLCVFPEMDLFEIRSSEKYFGPLFLPNDPNDSSRPGGACPQVFVYLSVANRCLSDILDYLKTLGVPAIGYIRGLPETQRKSFESSTLLLSGSLVNLERAAAECGIAVTQGGLHTSARMLLAGARLLICPEQLEQTLLAYRLNQRGLCEFVSCFSEPETVKHRFDRAASSVRLGENAAAFAAKHVGYHSADTVREIVDTCLRAV